MALLGDGSVELSGAGGARLLLSPCGSEYLYEEALPPAAHPLQPADTCRRRVAFVLSAHRVRGGRGESGAGEGSGPGGASARSEALHSPPKDGRRARSADASRDPVMALFAFVFVFN